MITPDFMVAGATLLQGEPFIAVKKELIDYIGDLPLKNRRKEALYAFVVDRMLLMLAYAFDAGFEMGADADNYPSDTTIH